MEHLSLSLKRDNTNSKLYFVDGQTPDFSSFKNKEKLLIQVYCVQPFETNKTTSYDYTKLICEAHSWVENCLKDQYDVLNPVFLHNCKWAGKGIRSIDFECTIIKNTIP